MKHFFVTIGLLICIALPAMAGDQSGPAQGGEVVNNTFQSTRLVNMHSIESLHKRELDFRVTHRFGDIGGSEGGYHSMWGMDQSADIRISLEYGWSDRLMFGIGRSKGAGYSRELFDGFAKYRILRQSTDGKMPVSLTAVGSVYGTGVSGSSDVSSIYYFEKFVHRLSYSSSLLVGRKFGDLGAVQVGPEYVYRNYVAFDDVNGIAAIAVAGRIRLSQMISVIGEYHYVLTAHNTETATYVNPSAIGFEFYTGGHVFHMNFSNSRGIGEGQFVPTTVSKWAEGSFRLGFNISKIWRL